MKISTLWCMVSMYIPLILCVAAPAQNRSIAGKVTDESGEPLKDVHITIYDVGGNGTFKCKTDINGEYVYILGNHPATYRVVALKEGYRPQKEENVKTGKADALEVDFTLSPGPDRKFAFEVSEKETAKNPDGEAQQFFDSGVALYNDGKMKEAALFFRKAIEADPEFAKSYYLLATCLSADEATVAEAMKLFKKNISK